MDFKTFLEQQKEAAPKRGTSASEDFSDRIVLLNLGNYTNLKVGEEYEGFTNQGTVFFIPITPLLGSPIEYAYDVTEWQVDNREEGAADAKWTWFRVPQLKNFRAPLTEVQKNIVQEIHSMAAKIQELGYENDWVRTKNYAIVFGYILKHTNIDNVVISDKSNRKLAAIICPSKNFAKASAALSQAIANYEGAEEYYGQLYNRESERKIFLELSFVRGQQFGYDVAMAAKGIDLLSSSLMTEAESKSGKNCFIIPQNLIDKCGTLIGKVFGDCEGTNDFNEAYYIKMHSALKAELAKALKDKEQSTNLPPKPTMEDMTAKPDGWPQNGTSFPQQNS